MLGYPDFYRAGDKDGVRLKPGWVKQQQPLISRGGGGLVLRVVWTMVMFCLCGDVITESSGFCLHHGHRVALSDSVL